MGKTAKWIWFPVTATEVIIYIFLNFWEYKIVKEHKIEKSMILTTTFNVYHKY